MMMMGFVNQHLPLGRSRLSFVVAEHRNCGWETRDPLTNPQWSGQARGRTANWTSDVSEAGRCEVMECPYSMEGPGTVLTLATGIPSG